MPIYEYRCTSCSAELEKLQKISDPPLLECPECGRDGLVKLISASSFRLKGSGWYETDFKTGSKKNGAAEAPSEGAGNADTAGAAASATSPEAANAGSKTPMNDVKGKEQAKTETNSGGKSEKKPEAKSTAGANAGNKNQPAAKP